MGAAVKTCLTSREVRRLLKISTCDLAHLREEGQIRAEKRGNAYYYVGEDVEALRARKQKQGIARELADET
jgi:DNA-binding transcriptional MerR regulator